MYLPIVLYTRSIFNSEYICAKGNNKRQITSTGAARISVCQTLVRKINETASRASIVGTIWDQLKDPQERGRELQPEK